MVDRSRLYNIRHQKLMKLPTVFCRILLLSHCYLSCITLPNFLHSIENYMLMKNIYV